MPEWLERKDLNVTLTIDNPADGWEHKVSSSPTCSRKSPQAQRHHRRPLRPADHDQFTLAALVELGFPDDQIYTTLESA